MSLLTDALLKASAELGIDFEPTFTIDLPHRTSLVSVGLVRAFGSKLGTVIFGLGEAPALLLWRSLDIACFNAYLSIDKEPQHQDIAS